MKKQYKEPTLEVLYLNIMGSVITTSGDPVIDEDYGGLDGEEYL